MHRVGLDQRRRRVGVQEHGERVPGGTDGLHRSRIALDDVQQPALPVEDPQVRLAGTADHQLVLDLRQVVRRHLAGLDRLPQLDAAPRNGHLISTIRSPSSVMHQFKAIHGLQ